MKHTIDGSLWDTIGISGCDHHSEVTGSFWILLNHGSKDLQEIWFVPCLLAVWHNFIELVSLNKTLDYLVWSTSLLKDSKSHLWIILSDQISKLITHGQLTFLHPTFDEMRLLGLQNWPHKLDRLNLVKSSTALKKGGEVHHNWLLATWGSWKSFKFLDSIIISDESTWSITSNSSSTCNIISQHALLELSHKHLISTWKTKSCCKFKGNILLIWDVLSVHNIFNKVVLLDIDSKHLTCLVDADDTISCSVAG